MYMDVQNLPLAPVGLFLSTVSCTALRLASRSYAQESQPRPGARIARVGEDGGMARSWKRRGGRGGGMAVNGSDRRCVARAGMRGEKRGTARRIPQRRS